MRVDFRNLLTPEQREALARVAEALAARVKLERESRYEFIATATARARATEAKPKS